MWTTLLIHAIILGVSVASDVSEKITVCQEEDNDLRVDCKVVPTANPTRVEYEFSMARGGVETIINTNVSGISADDKFKRDKAYAEFLDTDVIRLTITDFTLTEDTTFMCKLSGTMESVLIEPNEVLQCSAISVSLHSIPLMLSLLFCLYLLLPLGPASH